MTTLRFAKKVVENIHKPPFQSPIAEVLLNQNFFNGIGNYLRAEILHRAGISPFQKASEVFANTKELLPNFDVNTFNANSDKGLVLLFLCHALPIEVIQKDLDKYGSPEQYALFEKWLRIYGKGETRDLNGRKVHFASILPTVIDLPDIGDTSKAFAPTPSIQQPTKPDPAPISFSSEYTENSFTFPNASENTTNPTSHNTLQFNLPEPQTRSIFDLSSVDSHSHIKKQTLPQDVQDILDHSLPEMQTNLLLVRYLKQSNSILGHDIDTLKVFVLAEYKPVLAIFEVFKQTHNLDEFIESCSILVKQTTDHTVVYKSFADSRSNTTQAQPAKLPIQPTFKPTISFGTTSFTGPNVPISSRPNGNDGPRLDCWRKLLSSELSAPYFQQILSFVKQERTKYAVYPKEEDVFAAFDATPLDNVKVVIIGQDPYFNEGQANGLCFSVAPGVPIPPSLKRIFKVLTTQIPGFKIPESGDLSKWAKQGVLLLNATLTVQTGKPNSHERCGWQNFTDAVIRLLSQHKEGLVFML